VATIAEARALHRTLHGIIRSSNERAITGLPDDRKKQLVADLTMAGLAARAGIRLSEAVRGSRVKLAAEVVRLLAVDVCAAARRAGLPVGVDRDPTVWPAQWLAWRIARELGLIAAGETLEPAMREAIRAEPEGSADVDAAAAWLDGRLVARVDLQHARDACCSAPAAK
jgi:hypothetical protein